MSWLFEGRRGAAIALVLMLLVAIRLGGWLLNGRRERDYSGSLLHDHVQTGLSRVDTGPEWMKGKLGTLLYGLMGGAFILAGIAAAIHVLIYGPAKKHAAPTENSASQTNSSGAF